MNFAPVALFVYKRLNHLQKVINALKANTYADKTDLIIFSDGPKDNESKTKIEELRRYLKTIDGFNNTEIVERENNWGLAKSVISGVSEIIVKYGKAIILEDDIVVSKYFLEYMNESLDMYEEEDNVVCIHGYVYPVKSKLPDTFFLKGTDCWGWATWKRGWDIFEKDGKKLLAEIKGKNLEKEFNFNDTYPYTGMLEGQANGEIDSWAIRWYASAFLQNKLTLYPGKSLVKNIGNDGSGSNCPVQNEFDVEISDKKPNIKKITVEHNKKAYKAFEKYFIKKFKYKKNIIRRMLSGIKSRLHK